MAVLAACLPGAIWNPQFGVLTYIWVGLMNPHRFVYRLSTFPVALTFGLATLAAMVLRKRFGRFPVRTETVLILVWSCYTTLTTMVALNHEAWVGWDRLSKILFMAIIASMLLQSRKDLNRLILVITGSIAFFAVKGGIFSILTKGNYLVWGPPDSFIADNNDLALAELMVLPLLLYFIRQETKGWRRLALRIAFVLSMVGIAFSYSRGALVAGAGLALVIAWRSRYRFRAITLGLIAMSLLVAFAPPAWMERMHTIKSYQEDQSALGRFNAWGFAWNLANARPIGGGFRAFTADNFTRYAPDPDNYHEAHSIYFQVLGEQGFPGLAIFLGILGASLLRLQKIRKQTRGHPEWKWAFDLSEMLQCSLIAYALAGTFLGLAYFDLYYYIIIAGVLLDVVVLEERRRVYEAVPAPVPPPGLRPAAAPTPA
jgi:probable O-glycosylation ligase (exosortase A-associated)